MKITEKTTNLNLKEIEVLKAVSLASIDWTGGEFTYFEEVMEYISDMKENQVKGYLSQLVQKNYIHISDDEFKSISRGSLVGHLNEYKF